MSTSKKLNLGPLAEPTLLVCLFVAFVVAFFASPPATASPDQTTYNYAEENVDGNKAWEYPADLSTPYWTPPAPPAPGWGNEATAADYDDIENCDDNRWRTNLTQEAGDYDHQYYRLTVDEDPSTIDNFTIRWEGYGDTPSGPSEVDLYIYNWNTSSWELVYENTSGGAVDIVFENTYTENISHYFNENNEIYFDASTLGDVEETCPVLYLWNGERWVGGYEAAPAGGLGFPYTGGFQQSDSVDWLPIGIQELVPTEDGLRMLIREEQNEITYLDQVMLYGVTHPQGTEIYSAGAVKWYLEGSGESIHTVRKPQPPVAAYIEDHVDENNLDILPHISASDDYWTPYGTENHNDWIVLDFGDLSQAEQIKLLVKGRTQWVNAPGILILPPYVEVWRDGEWHRVEEREDSWFDQTTHNYRTFCIDITDWFEGCTEYKLRINDWQKKSYDYFAVDTSLDEYELTPISLNSADLRHSGFIMMCSGQWEYSEANKFYTDNSYLSSYHAGNFTRTGDVTPLLVDADDMFTTMWVGDEVELLFENPTQQFDSYVLMMDSWYKVSWIKYALGQEVNMTTPLPFHDMPNYPYSEPEWEDVRVWDGDRYIVVSNGELNFWFRKGALGFTLISDPENHTVIGSERWALEYKNALGIWRQRGTPVDVEWERMADGWVRVRRHYSNWSGSTTFTITYDIYGGRKTKITVEGDVDPDNYRLVWKGHEINKTFMRTDENSVRFWNEGEEPSVFDWYDVYQEFEEGIVEVDNTEFPLLHRVHVRFYVGWIEENLWVDPSFGLENTPQNENYPWNGQRERWWDEYQTRWVEPNTDGPHTHSLYCDQVKLTVNWTPPPPPTQPQLDGPENGSSWDWDNVPDFEWTLGENATSQRFVLDNDPDFGTPLENVTVDNDDNTYTTGLCLSDDNYYWMVVAVNATGENASENWTFEIESPSGPWWDLGWAYRRAIKVCGSRPENYPVQIVIPYDDNMQADFDDLRFTENDGTLLDYWVENYNSGDNAIVWVEKQAENDLIWMYYGNSGVSSAENGFNVFTAFDDFESYVENENAKASLGWSRTGILNATNYYRAENNPSGAGMVLVSGESGDGNNQFLWQDGFGAADNYAYGFRYYAASYQDGEMNVTFFEGGSGGTWHAHTRSFYADARIFKYYDGAYLNYSPTLSGSTSAWMDLEYRITSSGFHLIIDENDGTGGLNSTPTDGLDTIRWLPEKDKARTAYIDDFYIRKYIENEPTTGIGIEHPIPPPTAPTLYSPADGTVTNDNTPAFEWTLGQNAENHRLLIDNDSDFLTPDENRILTTENTYTIAAENSLPDDNYSWKVVAINKLYETDSAVWTFAVDTVAPGKPTLLTPENNSVENTVSITFTWTGVWFDHDWSERRVVTVRNTSGETLENYAVRVNVEYDPAMQPDFDDLRFCDNDSVTELDYWLENYNSGDSAGFWVKIPEIPASDNHTIWMYYGNAGVSTTSAGENTFSNFFDDFQDGDISDWENYGAGDITLENIGTNYVLLKNSNNDPSGGFTLLPENIENFELIAWTMRTSALAQGGGQTRFGLENGEHDGYSARCYGFTGASRAFWIEKRNGGTTAGNIGSSSSYVGYQDVWYRIRLRRFGTSLSADLTDENGQIIATASATDNTTTSFDRLVIHSGYPIYFDNLAIRRYVSPDPSAKVGTAENVTYQIQIDDENTFTPPYVHENANITENWYTYEFPTSSSVFCMSTEIFVTEMVSEMTTTYYWRVRAMDTAGNVGEWADNFSLTTRQIAPKLIGEDINLLASGMIFGPLILGTTVGSIVIVRKRRS